MSYASTILKPTLVILCVFAVRCAVADDASPPARTVEVVIAEGMIESDVSGRLYVFVSERNSSAPMRGPSWFSPEPFFRLDVDGFGVGESRFVDDRAAAFPAPLSSLPSGKYRVQALLDFDTYAHHPARGAGNLYSNVVEWDVDIGSKSKLKLVLNQVVEGEEFDESTFVKEVRLESSLLSDFFGRTVYEFAAVVLPPSYYDEPDRMYPTIYSIPGFGGTHRLAIRYANQGLSPEGSDVDFIHVMLSGNCKWGHHVYADSATNGPRGAVLIEEMIPHLEKKFRLIPNADARFLTGHSSGGWSSLWLQVRYPSQFGGVWSTAPDPVDFRDFQQIDLYARPPLSVFHTRSGERRPLARRGETPVVWFEDFSRMDDVLGVGGQLRSFEAVFSPLDADGLPQRLWDRTTGQVDPQVADAWKKYDINLRLKSNWHELKPLLAGKLHIFTGSLDTYYLEGAVELLAETLGSLESDAEVTVVDGANHSNLMTQELRQRIRNEMRASYLRHHPPKTNALNAGSRVDR